MKLSGKIALVTGAASGIGAASAKAYAAEGAAVVLVDIDFDGVNRIVQKIQRDGGEALAVAADMGNLKSIEAMLSEAKRRFGKLDILHNNTAMVPRGPVGDLSVTDWQRALDVGLTSYWYAIKCALPDMIAQQYGVILNTASISGLAADHGMGGYNVVKAGVINLTKSVAIDYARKGIRCNAICPGIIFTDPFESKRDVMQTHFDKMAGAVPMGRFGTAEEVANFAAFLVSDAAPYINGSAMVIDGGRLAFTGTPSPVAFNPY